MRVVVSLSTIPSRVPHLGLVLDSLLKQTYPIDQIYINLPYWSKREKCLYPPPQLPSDSRITLLRCQDHGPITKLVPTLDQERDPETIIITVDDDTIYFPEQIGKLVHWCQEYPGSAVGSSGIIVGSGWGFFGSIHHPNEVTQVSVLEGISGAAYRRKFFTDDLIDYTGAPDGAFYHDDFWISGHLAQKGIPRLVHPDVRDSNYSMKLPNGLSTNIILFIIKLLPLISYLQGKGLFREPQVAPHLTTLGTWFFLIFLLGIVLILAAFLLLMR